MATTAAARDTEAAHRCRCRAGMHYCLPAHDTAAWRDQILSQMPDMYAAKCQICTQPNARSVQIGLDAEDYDWHQGAPEDVESVAPQHRLQRNREGASPPQEDGPHTTSPARPYHSPVAPQCRPKRHHGGQNGHQSWSFREPCRALLAWRGSFGGRSQEKC